MVFYSNVANLDANIQIRLQKSASYPYYLSFVHRFARFVCQNPLGTAVAGLLCCWPAGPFVTCPQVLFRWPARSSSLVCDPFMPLCRRGTQPSLPGCGGRQSGRPHRGTRGGTAGCGWSSGWPNRQRRWSGGVRESDGWFPHPGFP